MSVDFEKAGGPAFPFEFTDVPTGDRLAHSGMSLRDWFAGQTLRNIGEQFTANFTSEVIAQHCYTIADAMLKEREK